MNFLQLKKNLKKETSGFPVIRVAILCDFASQLLTQAFMGYGIGLSVKYEIFEADYDQIERQVLDPDSELYSYAPSYILIVKSTEKLLKEFYKTPQSQRGEFAKKQSDKICHLYEAISSRLNSKIILTTFCETDDAIYGNFAAKLNFSFPYQLKLLNIYLMDLSQKLKGLFLADFNGILARTGLQNAFDAKMFITADMVFSLDVLPSLSKCFHDIIQSIEGKFRKCLILDLDNTTWGGIIGDDGMEGIQIGDLGIGKAFTNLQLWVKELKNRGILIAVASKNTEEIAREPFEKHPDMVLKLSDISVFVANWENKVDNIRHIQSVLNISFDSMVFLDDNPFEREMVKQAIPDITIPSLPEDPAEYLSYLKGLNLFETASFSEEDLERTEQYQVEAKRTILQKSYESEEKFLESLQMKAEVNSFDQFTCPRIAQLSQRSNQFNLRTIRYTEEEITKLAASADYLTRSFTLEDVYGNYGLICFIILQKKDAETLFIDSWIMSCRVLKRGMEHFTLQKIIEAAKSSGFSRIIGEYIPTKKNALVKDHYSGLGFQSNGNGQWELNLSSYPGIDKQIFIQSK